MSKRYQARGYRLRDTFVGDTIQKIAERYLGDAGRWKEIVALNNLVPPYVIDNLSGIEESGDGGTVIITGERIKIPAAMPPNAVSDSESVFGTDIKLEDGLIDVGEDGDFVLISDTPNLVQALNNRFMTHLRELIWHPDYGNPLHDLIGDRPNGITLALSKAYGERTIRSDPRIDRLDSISTEINASADTINVDAVAITIDGRPLPVRSDTK